jgi:hypothetical protein
MTTILHLLGGLVVGLVELACRVAAPLVHEREPEREALAIWDHLGR